VYSSFNLRPLINIIFIIYSINLFSGLLLFTYRLYWIQTDSNTSNFPIFFIVQASKLSASVITKVCHTNSTIMYISFVKICHCPRIMITLCNTHNQQVSSKSPITIWLFNCIFLTRIQPMYMLYILTFLKYRYKAINFNNIGHQADQ